MESGCLNLHFDGDGEVKKHDAYSRLLFDVLRNDQTLFVSAAEVEAAWTWVDTIFAGWQSTDMKAEGYPAGSNGPIGAEELMARGGRNWHDFNE